MNSSYLETWRGSGNNDESKMPTDLPASSLEPHYSVQGAGGALEAGRIDHPPHLRRCPPGCSAPRQREAAKRNTRIHYVEDSSLGCRAGISAQNRCFGQQGSRLTSLPDLYLVRLNSDKRPHRKKGQKFLNCKCSLGVDGILKGKRYRRSLNTRSLDKAYRKLAAIERPDYREPKSIQDAIEAFKSSKEDVGHSTKRNHRRALDNFLRIAKSVGVTKLDDVEIETIDLFRMERRISAMTWTKELAILRNFFGFCVSRKWMSTNPAKEVKPPTVKPKPKEPYTQQEEVVRIFSGCDRLGRGHYERGRALAMFSCFAIPVFGSVMLRLSRVTVFETAASTSAR